MALRKVVIGRLPDDPLALRASIGGREAIGYYLQYRGDPAEVLAMLRAVLVEAERVLPGHVRPSG